MLDVTETHDLIADFKKTIQEDKMHAFEITHTQSGERSVPHP